MLGEKTKPIVLTSELERINYIRVNVSRVRFDRIFHRLYYKALYVVDFDEIRVSHFLFSIAYLLALILTIFSSVVDSGIKSRCDNWMCIVALTKQNVSAIIFAGIGVLIEGFRKHYKIKGKVARKRNIAEALNETLTNAYDEFLDGLQNKQITSRMTKIQERLLSAILMEIRFILKEFDESTYFEATLMAFKDGETGDPLFVEAIARANNQRKIGIKARAKDSIAYYVAKTGFAFVEGDYRNGAHPFPIKGISDLNVPYRSILFIPLQGRKLYQDSTVAVITIDCAKPYFFSQQEKIQICVKTRQMQNLMIHLMETLLNTQSKQTKIHYNWVKQDRQVSHEPGN